MTNRVRKRHPRLLHRFRPWAKREFGIRTCLRNLLLNHWFGARRRDVRTHPQHPRLSHPYYPTGRESEPPDPGLLHPLDRRARHPMCVHRNRLEEALTRFGIEQWARERRLRCATRGDAVDDACDARATVVPGPSGVKDGDRRSHPFVPRGSSRPATVEGRGAKRLGDFRRDETAVGSRRDKRSTSELVVLIPFVISFLLSFTLVAVFFLVPLYESHIDTRTETAFIWLQRTNNNALRSPRRNK